VFIPFCVTKEAANILTDTQLDPVGKIPEFTFCAVRVSVIEVIGYDGVGSRPSMTRPTLLIIYSDDCSRMVRKYCGHPTDKTTNTDRLGAATDNLISVGD